MKKILVTGVAGFIGAYLAKRLLLEGYYVVGIDNLNDYYDVKIKEERLNWFKDNSSFKFYKMDICDEEHLIELFDSEQFDIVVNLAAQAGVRYSIDNPKVYMQSNVMGFFNILECCRQYKVKHLIYASSSSVYGANKKIPYSVDDKVDNPVSLYAATKKSNELMAYAYSQLYDMPCTGLRFFTVYGPVGRPDMAYYSFAEKIINNEPIKVYNNGEMYRDFTYIDDIVEGLMRVINKIPSKNEDGVRYKIYNIGCGKPEKLTNMIEYLENELGKTAIKEFLEMQPGDVYQTYADISDFESDFGELHCVALEEGLHRFAEWFYTTLE